MTDPSPTVVDTRGIRSTGSANRIRTIMHSKNRDLAVMLFLSTIEAKAVILVSAGEFQSLISWLRIEKRNNI